MPIIKGSLPSNWQGWASRATPRHVVPEGLSVSVDLEGVDGSLWPGQCLDISATGVLIELDSQQIPTVTLESKVLVTLTLESEVAIRIPCLVRYCKGHRMGLFFPDASTRTVEQEDQLSQIIRTIEREALRAKTQGQFG